MLERKREELPRDWPVNFPFRVTAATTDPRGLILKVGERGIIRAVKDGNIGVHCVSVEGVPGASGWVDGSCLAIGKGYPGNIPPVFDIVEPEAPRLSDLNVDSTSDRLTKTISGLCSAYYARRNDLPNVPRYLDTLLNTPAKVQTFTRRIVEGVKKVNKGTLHHLLTSDADYDIWDLKNASTDATNDSRTGIYLIIYWDIANSRSACKIYTGSTTTNFTQRSQEHILSENDKEKATRVHYRTAREAKNRFMLPLCILPDSHSPQELRLAEQLSTNLFQTYTATVLSCGSEGWDKDAPDDPNNPGKLAEMRKIQRHAVDKETALILTKIANQVFEQTGWRGGIEKSVGKSFKAEAGLNWTSPLTEIVNLRTIWIKTEIPRVMATFRRTEHLVSRTDAQHPRILFFLNHAGGKYTLAIPDGESGPAEGTKVDVIFEVRLDGKPHHAPLARLPLVGSQSDWSDALSCGMRIEWISNGTTQFKQLQMKSPSRRFGSAPPGGLHGYNVAVALRSFFLKQQRRLDESQKKWMLDFGVANIKQVCYEHLSNTVYLQDLKRMTQVEGPKAREVLDMGNELLQLGAGDFVSSYALQTAWERLKDNFKAPACDDCRSNELVESNQPSWGRCDLMAGKACCTNCHNTGRPCTFTQPERLAKNPYLQRALAYAKVSSDGVFTIPNNTTTTY